MILFYGLKGLYTLLPNDIDDCCPKKPCPASCFPISTPSMAEEKLRRFCLMPSLSFDHQQGGITPKLSIPNGTMEK